MKKLASSVLFLCLASAPAGAHVELISPLRRHADKYIVKSPPCGLGGAGDVRGSRITTFRPGQTIPVRFHEYIGHPGHYRIAFSMDGTTWPSLPTGPNDLARRPNELTDPIPDREGTEMYEVQVTLPNVECDRCALRLVQVMTDKQGNGWGNDEFYYQCADLVLRADATADMASPLDLQAPPLDMTTPDLTTPPADLSSEPLSPEPMRPQGCACSVGAGAGPSGLGTAVGLLVLAATLLRRRRQ